MGKTAAADSNAGIHLNNSNRQRGNHVIPIILKNPRPRCKVTQGRTLIFIYFFETINFILTLVYENITHIC